MFRKAKTIFAASHRAGSLPAALLLICAILLAACSPVTGTHMPKGENLPLLGEADAPVWGEYKLRPGDEFDVKFFYAPELNDTVKIRPDGCISLQLAGEVQASGHTVRELTAELKQRYAAHLSTPEVMVILRSFPGYRIYVGGEVLRPRLIPLDGGLSAYQAVFAAGGNLFTGDMEKVILIRKGPEKLPVSYHLDLSPQAISNGGRDTLVALQPSDILFIPKTGIAVANQNVTQYVRNLLMFNGVSLGASFTYVYDGN